MEHARLSSRSPSLSPSPSPPSYAHTPTLSPLQPRSQSPTQPQTQTQTRSHSRRQYAQQDNRPTTSKELRGWYAYGVAAEVFAVCGVGSFLPITLEQLARERGVLREDGVTPCISAVTATASATATAIASAASSAITSVSTQAPPFLALLARDVALQKRDKPACTVNILGSQVNTSSFALYSFSLGVFVQALTLVSVGSIADYGGNRKRLLLTLSWTGATACMLFLFVFPQIYLIGSLLVVISVTCLGTSFVLLNSFLPLLVANHPSVNATTAIDDNEEREQLRPRHQTNGRDVEDEDEGDDDDMELSDMVDPAAIEAERPFKTDTQASTTLSNQISSRGVGLGYAAAVFVQLISIAILVAFSKLTSVGPNSTLPMRVVLFLVGSWWALFTIPTAMWLRRRPGPPLPSFLSSKHKHKHTSYLSSITFAWLSLWQTIKAASHLRQILLFLLAWFLLSDAIATVSGAAILFARTELQMGTEALAALSITATLSGILGAFSWPALARSFNLPSKHVVILCIALFEFIPLYALTAFIPFVRAWGVGGLQRPWEIFPLALILGFVMGGLSSYCRSMFGALVPPGSEAAFYALYAVTDKGSSVVGPAIVGRIVDRTGSFRTAFWFLAVLIVLPIPLVAFVDVERGRADALRMVGAGVDGGVGGKRGDGVEAGLDDVDDVDGVDSVDGGRDHSYERVRSHRDDV